MQPPLGERTVCETCRQPLSARQVALLLRRRPAGAFDALCVYCAKTVMTRAIMGYGDPPGGAFVDSITSGEAE